MTVIIVSAIVAGIAALILRVRRLSNDLLAADLFGLHCRHCSCVNRKGARFCAKCGDPLS